MKIALRDVAAFVNARIEGDESLTITGFGPIESAPAGSVTFLANPKYTSYIYTTQAAAVLVADTFVAEKPLTVTLLRVADPYSALAELMTVVRRMEQHLPTGLETPCRVPEGFELPADAYVGAFAYISDNVRLAEGVKVFPGAYLGAGVEVGRDTVIRPGVKIYEGCRIGAGCIIHAGAVIGADGFGFAPTSSGRYEKIPQLGNVVIEDDVEIGANTTVDRATFGSTRIGRGTKLDNLIQIAHNVHVGTDNVFASQVGIAGSARIGDSNMIGGQVGIAGHISIGDRNKIGAQSGIPNTVGSGLRLMGYPAIDARQWAKNLVYVKKIPALMKRLDQLEKYVNQKD